MICSHYKQCPSYDPSKPICYSGGECPVQSEFWNVEDARRPKLKISLEDEVKIQEKEKERDALIKRRKELMDGLKCL